MCFTFYLFLCVVLLYDYYTQSAAIFAEGGLLLE